MKKSKDIMLTWGMYKRREFHLGILYDEYGTLVSAGMGGGRMDVPELSNATARQAHSM